MSESGAKGVSEHYIRDLLNLLLERARDAKRSLDEAKQRDPRDVLYESGRAQAYYEVVSTALGQLQAFGLPPSDFDIPPDFDPDRELT